MACRAQYEKVEAMNNFPLKVQPYHFLEKSDMKAIPKHWHRSIELIVPEEFGVEVWIEGEIFHVYPGTMLLVNSRNIHEFRSINASTVFKGYTIKIKYDFFRQSLPQLDCYQFEVFYEKEKQPYLFQLIEEIFQFDQINSAYNHIKINSLAYELCYQLVCNYCVKIDEKKRYLEPKNKSRLIEILSYLDQHITEVFDAQEVANHFHLSYGYLAKLFKNELGMTMREYINSVRVRNASFELLESQSSIIEVAQKHGFVSPKSFYKEFEKVYHMTPKQYRKQW